MYLLFLAFIIFLWLGIVFFTNTFGNAVIFILAFIAAYFLQKNKFDKFAKISLLPSKAILAFSFWGCIGFCLFSYQQSINCLSCMQAYLGRSLNATFGCDTHQLFKQYERFEIMFIFACIWAVIFMLKKGRKKC